MIHTHQGSRREDYPHVSIRYIAVLGFQLLVPIANNPRIYAVSIRYIAVLGFQRYVRRFVVLLFLPVSIRYIAVLGFQHTATPTSGMPAASFHPLYRGTWFPTMEEAALQIRMQRSFHPLYRGTWFPTFRQVQTELNKLHCFHPLYRGTWFPTSLIMWKG